MFDRENNRWLIGFISVIGLAALISLSVPALAAPALQMTPFPTPTPGSDGRIIYIVKSGDTLLRISLISGVSVEELRGLNNLTSDNIFEGQELLLGLGGPSQTTPTPGPSPTPTQELPTPSPQPGFANLCIILYNDLNGDSIRQEEEPSIPGGAISVNNRAGDVSLTTDTEDGLEHHCFEEVPEGEYTLTVAIPEGYNPTTESNYTLVLIAGDETFIDFGAQANSLTLIEAPTPTGSGRSPLLGIVGGIILFIGLGLAVFAWGMMRVGRKPS
jgi:LysM repeat protein